MRWRSHRSPTAGSERSRSCSSRRSSAQLYIHDPVASISQPVRRLRGFEGVTLNPGQSRTIAFTLDRSDFGFYDNRGRFVVEPGEIDVYAGDSSAATMTKSFTVR